MDGYRSEESGPGEVGDFAAVDDSVTRIASDAAREGDVIHGLRSGLVFSLAIWVMLFAVGALVFD